MHASSAFYRLERGRKEGIMLVKWNEVENLKEEAGQGIKIYSFIQFSSIYKMFMEICLQTMGQGNGIQLLEKIVYNRVVQTIKEECKWWIHSFENIQ